MNPNQLAGLVKRAYPNFDMTYFDYRLKLQKLVYLMKASNLNLGYAFRLHLNGPYSTMLSRDGFDMPAFNECRKIKFENVEAEKKFLSLLNFLDNKKEDVEIMEIIASLHLFHKLYPDKTEEELIISIKEKSPKFNDKEEEIKGLLDEIKICEFIKW